MVQAWYMNSNDDEDQRSERHLSPPQFVQLDELKNKTGVLYWEVSGVVHLEPPIEPCCSVLARCGQLRK